MQTKRLTTKPTHEVIAAIEALDLTSIRIRMMDAELGDGWSVERTDNVEAAYRKFLTMVAKYPDDAADLMLSEDVDEFWHAHILHTMKYAQDCEATFGFFLHHTPHRRTGTADEAQKREEAAKKTRALYEREPGGEQRQLGTAYCGAAVNAAYCGATVEAAYCGAAVKAAYCGAAVKAAYCGAAVKAAYCGAAVKAAYCGAAVKAAYCGAAVKAAYCGAAVKAAYCGAAVKAAYCGAAVKAAYCGAARERVARTIDA